LLHGELAKVGTFTLNKVKALAILAGADPLCTLKGNKVRSFFSCVLNPQCYLVCVDGHAYGVAKGNGQRLQPKVIKDDEYLAISQAYQAVAAELNILPLQLQAITWLSYRRIHGINV
jgi:hypothetical protein